MKRTLRDAIEACARVQIDITGRGVYHLFFANGTESYACSRILSAKNIREILRIERYTLAESQEDGMIQTFAKA
jgi:hypothetical protein